MSSITDTFSKALQNVKNLLTKSVSKSYISNEAAITIESLNDSMSIINQLQSQMRVNLDIVNYLKKDKPYINYVKKLSGQIAQEEAKQPLQSLIIISDVYTRELNAVKSYVSHNKEADKLVSISDVKYSQVALVGLLEQAIWIDRFVKAFVFKTFYYEKPNDFKKDFPWMSKLIDDQNEFVTDQVNRYSGNYKNHTSTMTDKVISYFKKKTYDPTIVVDGTANTNYASLFEEDSQIKQLSLFGINFSLNIFAFGANMYILYNHNRIMQKEYEKAWMDNHVMSLQLKLSNMNPESDEFKRLQKVIDNYNTLIASSTKEINEYRNS